MIAQHTFTIETKGRGMINLTASISDYVSQSKISTGLCNAFLHHTSASLILCENADNTVQRDLEAFMSRLVIDGDKLFKHDMEGPDDMPAHIRSVLTQNSISIPISQNRLYLGTWQGIYLWEHRLQSHTRKITITLLS